MSPRHDHQAGSAALPTSVTPEAIEGLVDALPEETFQLIVREAYLFRAGEVIAQAREAAKARQEEVSSTRPPFLALRRSETKDAFAANLAAASQDLSLYEKAAQRNADAMRKLRKFAELQLETSLRENDATYYAGLVSESLVADWHRCVTRLQANLVDFVAEIGSARNSLVGARMDENGVHVASDVTRKAVLRAAELGGMLAQEVTATTELAEERDRQLQGTAFAKEFPRLPSFDFGGSLKGAVDLPVAMLHQQFELIMKGCDELRQQGLPALIEQVKQAEKAHAAVKESYLVQVWQALRDYALQHYVQEDDLTEVARATEEMFEDGLLTG